jgi:endonuclease YncB( thermonuclease family)
MLLNGWAWLLDRYCPPEHYYQALAEAQYHRRGIWSRDDNVEPWEFKKQNYRRRQPSRAPSSQGDLFS